MQIQTLFKRRVAARVMLAPTASDSVGTHQREMNS